MSLRDETWSPRLEQQLELALCRVYGELPSARYAAHDENFVLAPSRIRALGAYTPPLWK